MGKRVPVVLLVLAALGGATWYFLADRGEAGPLTLYGNVDIREVDLGFRVPGRLVAMRVEEGDRVSAGDVLAELDPEAYRQALRAALGRVGIGDARGRLFRGGGRGGG